MNAQSNDALTTARRFIEALSRRDGAGLCAVLHDDVVLESPFPMLGGEGLPGSRRCQGEGVHAHMRNMPNVLGSLRFENVAWRKTEDGLVLFQADGRATLADGTPYDNHYLMLFEVTGGKIARWQEYFSPVIAARANGMPLDLLP